MKLVKNLMLGTLTLGMGLLVAFPINVGAVSPHQKVPGNNGTLKVHEKGTPAATESNDPKVCEFNFEGFGFDQGQSGVVVITTQGGGNAKTEVKRVDLPAANVDGYIESLYVTLPDGHYKTTAYGKDVHGNVDYSMELKAKSKVIKVECAPVAETPSEVVTPNTPQNPGNTDGTDTDTTKDEGHVLAESASTVKGGAGEAQPLPGAIAATGGNLLQALLNTLFAGLGVYSAAMLRRR